MNIKHELEQLGPAGVPMFFNNIDVAPKTIKAIMINEVVPVYPQDDFYGGPGAAYLSTAIPLFQKAGISAASACELLDRGIYITNAVKTPKDSTTIETAMIAQSLPYLEKELSLFPNVKVIMLMGDVAKKAFNMIAKKAVRKNAIPAISTYKIRSSQIYYDGIRLLPSYIMTGQNILIEKSKFQMAAEDIAMMYGLIRS